MYTFLTELFGVLIRENNEISILYKELYYNNNWLIYNIYNLLFFLYFYFVFWAFISNKKNKRIIQSGAILFLFNSIINPLFQSFSTTTQLSAYIIGSLVLLMCIYFYRMDLKESYGVQFLKKDLLSWLSLGMLIFYIGYLPIKIIRYYMALYDFNISWVGNLQIYLIVSMYLIFGIGFIVMRRRKIPNQG